MVNTNGRKRTRFWLGILISAVSLIAIFVVIDPREILAALREANYAYLLLSATGVFLFLVIRAVRWRYMLNNAVPWLQVFHIQNIGYMLTYILPFRLGDVGRAVLIGNVPPITLPQGLSSMVVERVLDLLFIVTLLPFTLATVDTVPDAVRAAALVSGGIATIAILLLVLVANQRALAARFVSAVLQHLPLRNRETWENRFGELLAGLSSLTGVRRTLTLGVLSILVWLPIIFAYYAGLRAVHLAPTLAGSAFVVCAAALSITAPSSPGQVGVFHAGVTFALVQVLHQPQGASASFAFLYHALNFLLVLILGVVALYGTGSTLSNVVAATRGLMQRQEENAHA